MLTKSHLIFKIAQSLVNRVLDLLDLRPIAGSVVSGLSKEERKRLTIGVEMAADPPILFLDEPTTGNGENLQKHAYAYTHTHTHIHTKQYERTNNHTAHTLPVAPLH